MFVPAVHDIVTHGYVPPQEFCDPLLRCPPMHSKAYFEAIVANAPQKYAQVARKRLAESMDR